MTNFKDRCVDLFIYQVSVSLSFLLSFLPSYCHRISLPFLPFIIHTLIFFSLSIHICFHTSLLFFHYFLSYLTKPWLHLILHLTFLPSYPPCLPPSIYAFIYPLFPPSPLWQTYNHWDLIVGKKYRISWSCTCPNTYCRTYMAPQPSAPSSFLFFLLLQLLLLLLLLFFPFFFFLSCFS